MIFDKWEILQEGRENDRSIRLYSYSYLFIIDGKVARTKKNRTETEKNFGDQIDSIADLICFGVLPVSIGLAQLRISGIFTEIVRRREYEGSFAMLIMAMAFVINIKVRKPGKLGLAIIILLGLIELEAVIGVVGSYMVSKQMIAQYKVLKPYYRIVIENYLYWINNSLMGCLDLKKKNGGRK